MFMKAIELMILYTEIKFRSTYLVFLKKYIDNFIFKSMEYYRQDVCEDFCLDNETKVYIYDEGYWDLLYRLPKRKKDTVYLPKNTLQKFTNY